MIEEMESHEHEVPQTGPPAEPPAEERVRQIHAAEPQRTVQGAPAWQVAGLIILLLGLVIYLHAVWATANSVLAGDLAAERVVTIGNVEFLQGTLGLVLAVIGIGIAAVAWTLPVRVRPELQPGTLEYAVVVEDGFWTLRLQRTVVLVSLGLLVLGGALAAYALRETVAAGTMYTWRIGGTPYRVHTWGLALVGLALLGLAAVAFRALGRNDLAEIVRRHADEGMPVHAHPPAHPDPDPGLHPHAPVEETVETPQPKAPAGDVGREP